MRLVVPGFVLVIACVVAGAREPAIGAVHEAAAQINVDVAVLSVAGQPVKGLTGADFEIYSNGQRVPISSCTPGPAPLNIVLLVDASGSMKWQMREEDVKDDVKDGFVPAVSATDRVRIGSIGGQNYLSPAFTSNPQELKRAADRALDGYRNFQSPSPVWDAVHAAVEALSTVEGRRAILLMSDGRATANRYSVEEVAEYAAQYGVLVNVGGEDSERYIRQSQTEAILVRAGAGMQWISDLTGGFQMKESASIREFFVGTLELMRNMYTLSFEAPIHDGDFHALEVRVKRPDGSIRARQVYKAPSGQWPVASGQLEAGSYWQLVAGRW
jgi:VWFA-related protein